MVFLGISILVVSLSVVLYRYRLSATWTQKEIPKGTHHTLGKTERENETENIEGKERSSIPIFQLDRGDEKGYAPTVSGDEPQAYQAAAIPQMKPVPQENAVEQSKRTIMAPPALPGPNAKRKPDQPPTTPTPAPPTFKATPKPSIALLPPPSTASILRGSPSRSLAPPKTTSLAPTTSTLSPSSRPSKKVLLDPGYSPLDWAHLTANPPTPTFLRGKDVPPQLIRVPPSLLKYHTGRKGKDAWGVWKGKVYNLTPYMKFHPGGVDQLMRGAGKEKDGERLFNEVHPWVSWENMLGECLVGILVSESEGKPDGGSELNDLERMD
ncbi:hypothetical protein N7G274_008976 [Stereocaulon virgatum]|uniref:Cytochrome b5 heme-binding domain-containing protein n=1 Tax=Stereocaulon virgatum TaxID=373712 RepID=A0ABR4A1U4_9LECA